MFLIRRAGHAVIVMLAVGLIAFVLFRFVGDPVEMMVSQQDSVSYRAELRHQLGLDEPVWRQYVSFMHHAASGDFGVSYSQREPVSKLLAERMPATLELVLTSALFSLVLGVPMGIYSAVNPRGALSRTLQAVSLIGISIPAFLLATVFIFLFAVHWHWLPAFGRGQTVSIGGWTTGLLTISGLKSLILPSVTLGLFQLTLVMRLVRAEMLDTLRTDFIKFARARGLSRSNLYGRHALRNVLVPVVTVVGVQLGSLVAFAVVTETVFQWPGMGFLFVQAIAAVDVPVMAGYLMIVGAMFAVINLLVDLAYYVIDPRLRDSQRVAGIRAGVRP